MDYTQVLVYYTYFYRMTAGRLWGHLTFVNCLPTFAVDGFFFPFGRHLFYSLKKWGRGKIY